MTNQESPNPNGGNENLPEIPDLAYKEDIQVGSGAEQRYQSEYGDPPLQKIRVYAPWTKEVDPDYQNAPPEAVEHFKDLKIGIRIH